MHAFLQTVLYGSLTEIKSRYRNNSVFLEYDRGVKIDRFEVSTPSLNEIFIQVVKEGR